jgi:hypothetical protein
MQLPGARTTQPDHSRRLHILKWKLRRKYKQIKHNWCYGTPSKTTPPKEFKISPIAAIPHTPKDYQSILDLSFRLRLKNGGVRASVNNTTEKRAPAGAIDQIGECLSYIIHALAEADEDAKIFMAKWDIKDGFWQMDCAAGEEWNFAYVLPQEEGQPTTHVVPTSLQMGWVESPLISALPQRPYTISLLNIPRPKSHHFIVTHLNIMLLEHRLIQTFRSQETTHTVFGIWSRFMRMNL